MSTEPVNGNLSQPFGARKYILDILFGPPLADSDEKERVGPAAGIPVFGLDALS